MDITLNEDTDDRGKELIKTYGDIFVTEEDDYILLDLSEIQISPGKGNPSSSNSCSSFLSTDNPKSDFALVNSSNNHYSIQGFPNVTSSTSQNHKNVDFDNETSFQSRSSANFEQDQFETSGTVSNDLDDFPEASTAKSTSQQVNKRKVNKKEKQRPPLPPCNSNCKLQCSQKIPEDIRILINKEFWKLKSWNDQMNFVTTHVKQQEVQRRTAQSISRAVTNKYHFTDGKGLQRNVCRTFFLCTLGFQKTNDGFLLRALKNKNPVTLKPSCEKRGVLRNRDSQESRDKLIKEHVESFNPFVSHYRRAHAPNRRYLNTEMTIKEMWEDFVEKNPVYVNSCSYEVYRRVIKAMNISFTKLGNEECEKCEVFEQHNPLHNKDSLSTTCEACTSWSHHIRKVKEGRELYQEHGEKSITESNVAYYSADLQKVIMLPSMPSFKSVLFTRRIVAFNQSFIPLRSTKLGNRPVAVLWTEAVSGRKKEDIISAFHQFLRYCRDRSHVIIWLDNCSAQNKNWSFLTFLVYIINSNEIATSAIDIYYFEPGHTFMSADSFHHQVESSMKKAKNTYDFMDFENVVREANARVIVKSMIYSDFSEWQNYISKAKLKSDSRHPHLNDIKQLRACRGNMTVEYKLSYKDAEHFKVLDFLQVKIMKSGIPAPVKKECNRGVQKEKKDDIIKKLVPLMPETRRKYWKDLPEADVPDLTVNNDDD